MENLRCNQSSNHSCLVSLNHRNCCWECGKMLRKKIKFGFEIETGKEIEIPLSHTVVTGLTNESGKTTAIMGLIKRSGLKALIIKTKIGEKAITEGTQIPPFYKENFDWEYAVDLLESSRKEKLKFERSWIIKYSKDATNLLEFKRNIDNALAEGKLRELEKSVLISLQAYLEKILPELQYAPLSKTLDIHEGINIMDLERFKEETQSLIIKSVLEEVLTKEKNTIIIIPECWRYLPEKLGNPVKRPAESFIRQGATNNNFLLIDSQDITGVSKTILKQVSNWILGYQREINEIKRTLDQIPLTKKKKPNPEEVATLKLGHFFVATSGFVKKAYAQPSWLSDKIAKQVAMGQKSIEEIEQPTHLAPYQIAVKKESEELDFVSEGTTNAEIEGLPKKFNELRDDFISNRQDFFNKFQQINETVSRIFEEIYKLKNQTPIINEDEIVMRVLQKIPAPEIKAEYNNDIPYLKINEETLISKILSRIPTSGEPTIVVSPLEAIRKKFLQEAKGKVWSEIKGLDDKQTKMLKWIEQKGINTKRNEVYLNCFGKSATSGNSYTSLNKLLLEMKQLDLIREDTHSKIFPNLKNKIEKSILQYTNAEEIDLVYNHILNDLLNFESGKDDSPNG